MILSSPKDAAKIKFGEQFTVNIPDLDPMAEDEQPEAFEKRFAKGLETRDAIFAAVDDAIKPKQSLLEIIQSAEGDAKEIARLPDVKVKEVRALAMEMGIETQGKNEAAMIEEIKAAL